MSLLLNSTRDFVCGVSECLCWIFVFINFMSIFYLAFCMFYKIDNVVKTIGYVWSGVVAAASVVVVAFHTCIFTVVCTVFTGLMIFGVLYVLLKSKTGVVSVSIVAKPEVIEDKEKEPVFEEQEPLVGMEVTPEEADLYNDYLDELLKDVDVAEAYADAAPENVEDLEQIEEPVSAPETYIFDEKLGRVIEPNKEESVVQTDLIAVDVPETEEHDGGDLQTITQEEKEDPVIEEIIVPVRNKFTDIVVSQIEGMPEMVEEEEKSREQLVKELENRPVMVKYQQVTFNNAKPEKKTKKKKEEAKPAPKINRGYQIDKFLNE